MPARDGTIVSSEPAITLRGSLVWPGGDMRVLWENNRGCSDLATVALSDDRQTVLWQATAPIPLRPGINHVRIRALGQPGAETFANVFYTPREPAPVPVLRKKMLHGQEIAYEAIDGLAIFQGDIVLGKEGDVAAGRFSGRFAFDNRRGLRTQAATIAPGASNIPGRWPVVGGVVRVPYSGNGVGAANISAAIVGPHAPSGGKKAGRDPHRPSGSSLHGDLGRAAMPVFRRL